MATSASPEASDLKRRGRQRLIGAVALVALLVVFVPMLLDSSPRPASEGPTLAIPVIPAKSGTQTEFAKAGTQAEPAKPGAPAPVTPVETAAQPKPSAPAKPSPEAPKAVPAPVATADPPRSGFAVQVGAFRDEEKLKQAREKLAGVKVSHYIERLDANGGGLTRLRAGPFPTREAAESALASIRRASLDGKVVALP